MNKFTFRDESLGISASDGSLKIRAGDCFYILRELSLFDLEQVYGDWQFLVKDANGSIADILLKDKSMRAFTFEILRAFGIPDPIRLSVSQIESLLFYYKEDQQFKSALLWQFHNVFPSSLNIPKEDGEISVDFNKYLPDIDPIDQANLFLMGQNKEPLAKQWPLSKIITLFMSKGFIDWATSDDNKKLLKKKEFEAEMEKTPIDLDWVASTLKSS